MKRSRIVSLLTAVTIAGAGAAVVTAQAQADTSSTSAVASASDLSSTWLPFAGHTFVITVDNGNVYRNTYSADGSSLHSVTIAGDGVGDTFDAPLQTAKVGYGLYFVSWVEPSGVTVSHVLNFNTNTVKVYFTFGTATGGRLGQLHSATLAQES